MMELYRALEISMIVRGIVCSCREASLFAHKGEPQSMSGAPSSRPAVAALAGRPAPTEGQASSGRDGGRASTAAASRSAFQTHGSSRSSSWALVRPETMRSSTSVSHACGSTPLSFAVATRLATIAQWKAPPSEPANRLFLRPRAVARSFCPPSSRVWKHGDLVRGADAMRATPAHQRGGDPLVGEVEGPDLVGRSGHDLLGGQDPLLDEAADDVGGDPELRGGLRHREPRAILLGRPVGVQPVDLADRSDTARRPGLA